MKNINVSDLIAGDAQTCEYRPETIADSVIRTLNIQPGIKRTILFDKRILEWFYQPS